MLRHILLFTALALPGTMMAVAQDNDVARESVAANDFTSSSLENLTQMEISISSFARRTEDLSKTPAAVYVITQQQIARLAATSIPDLLRMVPGLQVAQINASTWAVTARGFNNQFANKLLVLVDGRTIYSEIFSGVNWDEIDLPLDDFERIEVVRGPGAAVWGTNAVNGVINIITRRVRDRGGSDVSVNASQWVQRGTVQYGGVLSEAAQFSLRLNGVHRNALPTNSGALAFDGESSERVQGRIDWQRSWANSFILTGDVYRGDLHAQLRGGSRISDDQCTGSPAPFRRISAWPLGAEGRSLRHGAAGIFL